MARERYLLDSGESTIHDDSYLNMSREEKRKNWWDYNKWYVVLGLIAVIMIFYYTYQHITYVEPDYRVALLTQVSVEDAALTDLADHLEPYGEDLNGDGEVKIEILMYANDGVPSDDANYANYLESMEVFHTKYLADYNVCESMLWIIDEASYKMIGAQVEDVYAPFDKSVADPENDRWIPVDSLESMKDIKFPSIKGYDHSFTEQDINKLLSRYNFCLRMKENSQIEFKDSLIKYHADSEKLLNNLINNTKMVEG
ncbi:MAG: hypothetical protein E7564_10120 [Ruminococcaceae bacterium]|nr:hypothetical protein [Oscillospiraceae bacterium]